LTKLSDLISFLISMQKFYLILFIIIRHTIVRINKMSFHNIYLKDNSDWIHENKLKYGYNYRVFSHSCFQNVSLGSSCELDEHSCELVSEYQYLFSLSIMGFNLFKLKE